MGHRLLLAAADGTPTLDNLPPSIRLLIESADEILVLSPTLPDRLEWLASDTDKARREADKRLRSVLGKLESVDADVGGTIGADDPLQAFDDAIARFSPSHIVIGLRPDDNLGWQEDQLSETLFDKTGIPITIFGVSDR